MDDKETKAAPSETPQEAAETIKLEPIKQEPGSTQLPDEALEPTTVAPYTPTPNHEATKSDTAATQADTEKAAKPEKTPEQKARTRMIVALVVAGVALAIALVAVGFAVSANNSTSTDSTTPAATQSQQTTSKPTTSSSDKTSSTTSTSTSKTEADDTHEHIWVDDEYELVEVPAVTHEVQHDAVYGTETTYHTVDNVTGEIIDDNAAAHAAETGHSYSTGVPITNEVIVTPAWTETVVDTPATTELVVKTQKCTICGETREVSE